MGAAVLLKDTEIKKNIMGESTTVQSSECTVFRKTLSMLFQKSSFIGQNYPDYLCRKVFWDNGNLVEICRKKDMPQRHSGQGAQSLIVIFGDGELEWWVAGSLLEKTSIRQFTESGQSSGIREQWLKRYLNLLGDQYGICPGIGIFDGEDISRCCNTTEKLYPFKRVVSVNCASWINKDIERCVPCSKEYETVKHFLQQQGKLDKDLEEEEEQIEMKMAPVLDMLEDFPHLSCKRITYESEDALEISMIVGDINVGPPGKQFSLQLSRVIVLKSGQMKLLVLNEIISDENIYEDGMFDMELLKENLACLGKNLTACPGYIEYLFGVIHVSFKPFAKSFSTSSTSESENSTEDCDNEPKQYAILTCKRSKQWINVNLIISSLFNAKYPVCQGASMECQCQGCNVLIQQMKDKWPDVFQLFISSSENGLDGIIERNNMPDSSEAVAPEKVSEPLSVVVSGDCDTSDPMPICISPGGDHSPALFFTEEQSKILREVEAMRGLRDINTVDAASNQQPIVIDNESESEVTSSTVLKEIKMEEVVDSLSPEKLNYIHVPHESHITPEKSPANAPDFPADLNELLHIYLDLIDQHQDLTYCFDTMHIGYRANPYSRSSQAIVVKRRHGDVLDYHIKFHPTLNKPLTLATLNIYLDGTLEFLVTGHRKCLTRVTHGGPSRDIVNGYLSMLRSNYTFCGGISLSNWMSILPNVRPASVPNLKTLSHPIHTFIDENCMRWYEYQDKDSSDTDGDVSAQTTDTVNRCQLCQGLLDRLQYTQSIIHNTTIVALQQSRLVSHLCF